MQALFRLEKRKKFQALSTQMHTDWIDLFGKKSILNLEIVEAR
jgi:hypothetical protein